jgi:hypothetical protein
MLSSAIHPPIPISWSSGACSFNSANANGSQNGFGDGNWIKEYKGGIFIDWVHPSGGAQGFWEIDVQGTNGYVGAVCTSTPQ